MRILFLLIAFTLLTPAQTLHPKDLSFPAFTWKIPKAEPYRSQSPNGVVSYIVPDSTLPLFSLRVVFQQGTLQEDPSLKGLATLHAMTLQNGGTKKLSPEALEEKLELYALKLSVSVDEGTTSITLSGLSDYYDTAVVILKEILKKPLFMEERFVLNREELVQQILHRFDTPSPIMSTAWRKTLYPATIRAELLQPQHLAILTVKNLQHYHKQLVATAPVSVAAAGSISKTNVQELIATLFTEKNRHLIPYPIMTPTPTIKTVVVHKQGLNQAHIITGFPSFKRPDERYYPLTIHNDILGGGGFNSYLVSQVRSDAGLTYSVYSQVESNYLYPGTFFATLFTKNATINHAIGLTQKIIKQTSESPLPAPMVEAKKEELIQALPSSFQTATDIAFTYQNNEIMGRSLSHFIDYEKEIRALNSTKVHEVAHTYFKQELITVVVGDTTELFSAPTWEGYNLKNQCDTILTVEQLQEFGITIQTEKKR